MGGLMNRNSVVLTGLIAASADVRKKNGISFGEWVIK